VRNPTASSLIPPLPSRQAGTLQYIVEVCDEFHTVGYSTFRPLWLKGEHRASTRVRPYTLVFKSCYVHDSSVSFDSTVQYWIQRTTVDTANPTKIWQFAKTRPIYHCNQQSTNIVTTSHTSAHASMSKRNAVRYSSSQMNNKNIGMLVLEYVHLIA